MYTFETKSILISVHRCCLLGNAPQQIIIYICCGLVFLISIVNLFAVEKEKGGGEGLAAKNTATKKSKSVDGVSVGISKLSIGGSKKTKKTANFTMYNQKGSVKSNKTSTTTANFSFAGKSCANDGTVKGSAKAS